MFVGDGEQSKIQAHAGYPDVTDGAPSCPGRTETGGGEAETASPGGAENRPPTAAR